EIGPLLVAIARSRKVVYTHAWSGWWRVSVPLLGLGDERAGKVNDRGDWGHGWRKETSKPTTHKLFDHNPLWLLSLRGEPDLLGIARILDQIPSAIGRCRAPGMRRASRMRR